MCIKCDGVESLVSRIKAILKDEDFNTCISALGILVSTALSFLPPAARDNMAENFCSALHASVKDMHDSSTGQVLQ